MGVVIHIGSRLVLKFVHIEQQFGNIQRLELMSLSNRTEANLEGLSYITIVIYVLMFCVDLCIQVSLLFS